MYCPHCGYRVDKKVNKCPICTNSLKKSNTALLWILGFLVVAVCLSFLGILGAKSGVFQQLTASKKEEVSTQVETATDTSEPKEIVYKEVEVPVEEKQDTSALIQDAQDKVYTIFTELSQGSGFLINSNGDILTNAHVVEGYTEVELKDRYENTYIGTVIGYSNTSDVAVIRVPDLANKEPLPIESTNPTDIGTDVITLGSPQGYENTVTLGNISGIDRTFVIDQFEYEGVYQISAPISPGSSGGPLLEKETGKAIAINSAEDVRDANIGFSIPIYKIYELISSWINNPMDGTEVASLFYNDYGDYFYESMYAEEPGYFNEGDYEEEYDEYSELPEEWYEESYDTYEEDYEDYQESSEDWYDDSEDSYEEGYDEFEYEEEESLIGEDEYNEEETNLEDEYTVDDENNMNEEGIMEE